MNNFKRFESFAKGKLNSEKKKNTCVIYTRVSTKEQAEKNMSLATQKQACENYAKQKNYRILGCFGGTYESAKTDERIEFNNMLSFVKKSKDKISHIIVFSVDRFSRSGANAIYIAEQLKQSGINLISIMQPADVSTPSGALQQNIQFIFSEYDNPLRREKTIIGIRNALLRGEWCAKPPRGYDTIKINSKRTIVVNKEGEILRKAFLWIFYERLSQSDIQNRLLALGLKINKNSLSKMFRNPFYCGIISSHSLQGKIIQGKHEKLISQELFLAVNKILSDKRKSNSSWTIDNPELPLKNIVLCFHCKTPVTGYEVKKKQLYYYKCTKIGCCNNKSQKELHVMFKKILSQIIIDDKNYPNVKRNFLSNFIKVEKLNRKNTRAFSITLGKINGKIDLLEERFIAREISEELFNKHISRYNAEKLKIENEMDKAKAGLVVKEKIKKRSTELLTNLDRMWHFGDLKVKKIIQSTIFPKGLSYDKKSNKLTFKEMGKGFTVMEF